MKKIILFLTLLSSLSFSKVYPYLNGNFKVKVTENSLINNVKKKKVYDVSYTPTKMELKVLEPALNMGEIYTYSKSGKTLYSILSELSTLDTAVTQNKGNKKYIFENSILKRIEAKDYSIEFDSFNNNRPTKIRFLSKSIIVDYQLSY